MANSQESNNSALKAVQQFVFDRILDEGMSPHGHLRCLSTDYSSSKEPLTHSLALLGSLPQSNESKTRVPAIVRLEKTAFSADVVDVLASELTDVQLIDNNDIVRPFLHRHAISELKLFTVQLDAWVAQVRSRSSRRED